VFLLPTLAPPTTLGPTGTGLSHFVIDECFPVGDTLWLNLHEQTGRGDIYRTFMQVDTEAWTFTRVPVDAAVYDSSTRSPEGDDILFFATYGAMALLHEDDLERFNLYFGKQGGVAIHGPIMLRKARNKSSR
jgi:hypothetical protein